MTTAIGFVEADGVHFMYFGFGRKIVSADALPGHNYAPRWHAFEF